MILIKRLGRMRINNRKRLEYCSLFKCPKCGSLVIRPTGEGNRLTACSQSCSHIFEVEIIGNIWEDGELLDVENTEEN